MKVISSSFGWIRPIAEEESFVKIQRKEIREGLERLADPSYRKFNASLIPGKENILGVRLPALRAYAKEFEGVWREVLACYGIPCLQTPDFSQAEKGDRYLEEDLLCGVLIARAKTDFAEFAEYVRGFVPRVDNWAVCDCTFMGAKAFDRNPEAGWTLVEPYFEAPTEFGVRFAAVTGLAHFVREESVGKLLRKLVALSDGRLENRYYAQMAVAWAIAECIVKFPERARAALGELKDPFILRKSISKACESYRVSPEEKAYLKEYRNHLSRGIQVCE